MIFSANYAPDIVHRLMTNFAENHPVPSFLSGFVQHSLAWRAVSTIAGKSYF